MNYVILFHEKSFQKIVSIFLCFVLRQVFSLMMYYSEYLHGGILIFSKIIFSHLYKNNNIMYLMDISSEVTFSKNNFIRV